MALLITKKVKLIDKTAFAAAALDKKIRSLWFIRRPN